MAAPSQMMLTERLKMDRPREWPLRPFLPVRRERDNGDGPEVGVMVEEQGARVFRRYWPEALRFGVDLDVPVEDYRDMTQLQADGWVID